MQLAADFLRQEPEAYRISLQQYIKQGYSYPKARAMALGEHLPRLSADFLSLPNNILGIDYLRGIQHFHSTITPVTLSRKDNRYHDTVLSGENRFSSATAIRQAMYTAWAQKEPVPAGIDELPTDCWGRSMPIFSDDFSALLQYKLWLEEGNDLSVFSDVNPQLADRIKNRLNDFTTVENFCDLLKTKELTHSRIRRGLLHICLEMREEDLHRAVENGYTPYARILGFRREAAPLLHGIKENACIPLISKLADARGYLDEPAWSMLETEIKAAHIYETVVSRKFGTPFCNEYRRQLVIV
jgi:predicted nucleotidyltransferase